MNGAGERGNLVHMVIGATALAAGLLSSTQSTRRNIPI
jgi:hypothetical protein